jgi:hypothetical protein
MNSARRRPIPACIACFGAFLVSSCDVDLFGWKEAGRHRGGATMASGSGGRDWTGAAAARRYFGVTKISASATISSLAMPPATRTLPSSNVVAVCAKRGCARAVASRC